MLQRVFNFLKGFVENKPLSFLFNAESVVFKPLCETYVLASTISNPATLFIDASLCNTRTGFYICCSEQPFNSAVAYIDVSNLSLEQSLDASSEFLTSLMTEVRLTGRLAKRGNWNAF